MTALELTCTNLGNSYYQFTDTIKKIFMAKRVPIVSLVEMKRELGYTIDSLNHPVENVERFYSDLRPVSSGVYQRTKREFEEHEK